MAEDPDDKPRPPPTHVVGQPLDALSVDELAERIEALKEEILRLEAARAKKRAANAAADAFFRK